MRGVPLLLLVAGLLAASPHAGAQMQRTLAEVRDQGILYFKKEHYRPAKDQLDQAFRMPGGDRDFLTVFYRGQAAYKLLLLEVAFEMAHKARELAGEDERKREAVEAFLREMSSLYGGVTIKPAKGETNTEGRIFLEAKTGIINREKKQRFMSIRERFRSVNVQLPTTIYLPYGDYLANNVPFLVVKGEPPPTVELYLQVVRDEVPVESDTWLYVGIGAGVAAAAGVAAFFLLSEDEVRTESRTRLDINGLRVRP